MEFDPDRPVFNNMFPGLRTAWFNVTGETSAMRKVNAEESTDRARLLLGEGRIDMAILSAADSDQDILEQPFWRPWCQVVTKAPEFNGAGQSDTTVRSLEEGDMAAILPLFASSLRAGLPEKIHHIYSDHDLRETAVKRIESVLGRDSLAVVAYREDSVTGFGLASNEGGFLHVHDIVVSRDAFGTGTGLAMSQYIETFAFIRKLSEMRGTISVSSFNKHEKTSAALTKLGWKSTRLNCVSVRSGLV